MAVQTLAVADWADSIPRRVVGLAMGGGRSGCGDCPMNFPSESTPDR